jgi:hypothetical protein
MYKYPWKFQELARINGFLFKNKNKNKNKNKMSL